MTLVRKVWKLHLQKLKRKKEKERSSLIFEAALCLAMLLFFLASKISTEL